ncbi:MAG: ABC transporter permease subunit, partial [Thermomicrobiales bacterium]
GFAGSIFASAFQFVHPDQFLFSVSVMVLAMVILGGMGNVYGVILGALLIGGFDRILTKELNDPINWVGEKLSLSGLAEHDLSRDRFLVFGLALVIMMLLRPAGLLPDRRRRREFAESDGDNSAIPTVGTEAVS